MRIISGKYKGRRFDLPKSFKARPTTDMAKESLFNVLNNDIEITVLEIKGDQVKIGIQAPKEVPVYRKEIYLQIQKENQDSMNVEGMEALKNLF